MRMVVAVLVVWLICASAAFAGAWLRDKDSLFFAVSSTLRQTDHALLQENTIYGEYGLFPRATIGLDYNQLIGYSGHALVFLRFPLGRRDRKLKLAFETAAGGHHWKGDWNPMLKATLSLGRSIETGQGNGWLAVDAAIEQRFGSPDPLFKLDATLGLAAYGRIGPMLQIETAKSRGHPLFWAITPGFRYDLKKFGTLLIGYERKQGLVGSNGLKFGLWKTF